MRMPRPDTTRSGFTVIEVVVAILLIGVALLALEGEGAIHTAANEHERPRITCRATRAIARGTCTRDSMRHVGGRRFRERRHRHVVGNRGSEGIVRMSQTASYQTAFGPHTETYVMMGSC